MKRARLLPIILSSFLLMTGINTASYAEPETLQFDKGHSYVLWHVNHFGFSQQTGKWFVEGTLTLDENNPENSQVSATINMNQTITGIPALDKHLLGPTVFNVAKYPTATFVSDRVTATGKDKFDVEGMLTLHGVTKPITLQVTLNKSGTNPITHHKTLGFTATATLQRIDFDVKGFLPQGDKAQLTIVVEAIKETQPES